MKCISCGEEIIFKKKKIYLDEQVVEEEFLIESDGGLCRKSKKYTHNCREKNRYETAYCPHCMNEYIFKKDEDGKIIILWSISLNLRYTIGFEIETLYGKYNLDNLKKFADKIGISYIKLKSFISAETLLNYKEYKKINEYFAPPQFVKKSWEKCYIDISSKS